MTGVASASASAASTITRFAGSGSVAAPVAGPATSSPLDYPQGTALDSSGNLYIVDPSNERIEKVTPDGTLSIFAGSGSRGAAIAGPATSSPLYYPQGVAVDSAGNVYIADENNNRIEKVTPSGTLSFVAGTGSAGSPTPGPALSSRLNGPMGVAVGSDGTVYIADTNNQEIEKVTPGGTLSVIAGTGTPGSPTPGPGTSSQINDPEAVSVDNSGNVYVSDTSGNEVEKITPSDVLSIFAGTGAASTPTPGPAASSALDQPEGVGLDTSGDAYIADCNNNRIEEVDPSGTLSIVAGNGSNAAPTYGAAPTATAFRCDFSVTAAPDGTLYVTDIYNNTIDRIGAAAPGPPVQLTASPGDGSADVAFASPTDHGTSAITGYEISLDGGASWRALNPTPGPDGRLSAHLAGLSDGTTYHVQIRADNSSGAGLSAAISLTPSAPTTTTTPTTTGAGSTAGPGTTTSGSTSAPTMADAVTATAAVIAKGLQSDDSGGLALALQCPTAAGGICLADGSLSIAVRHSSQTRLATAHASSPAINNGIIARFAGVQIQSGQSKLVAIKLSPAAITYLRAHDISRVRVTLATHTTLVSGQSISATQHVWLDVSALTGCHNATGVLNSRGIGRLRLGFTHARAHHVGRYTTKGGFERYCVSAGATRVAYPTRSGRVTFALTANPRYRVQGVRVGMTLGQAQRHLHLEAPITVGKNAWYFIRGIKDTRILKIQHGIVRELGVTRAGMTRTRAGERRLLHLI